MIKRIEELTKSELLSLIYHELPTTVFYDHPVECAACGECPDENIKIEILQGFRTVERTEKLYRFICDRCEGGHEKTHEEGS